MTNENEQQVPTNRSIVEVSDETKALVEAEMPHESNQVKQETMALIEAIKTKAQSETQKAGEFTREKYLEAIRSARTEIDKMNFAPERVEHSMELIQEEIEKNWDTLVKQVAELGDRLGDAAHAAWDALTAPRSDRH
jgi:type I site-specific restriction-modification system R (restriction) subunit